MGMDVFGKNPSAEVGKYFRRSAWGWRRLAICIRTLAPAESASCRYWQTNDGDGLNKAKSIRLADRLDELIASGAVAAYVTITDAEIAALPRVACAHCGGTGIRTDAVAVAAGQPERIVDRASDGEHNPRHGEKGWCNGCHGWGSNPDFDTFYGLEVDDVKAFSAFIRASGGFQIC